VFRSKPKVDLPLFEPQPPGSAPAKRRVSPARPALELAFAAPMEPMRQELLTWYRRVGRALPWRTLWLEKADPYTIWVSEIMLQQTVIKAVIPVYARFLDRFPTLGSLAAADEDEVKLAVRGLGYYRRFRFLHAAAKQLKATGGHWPRTFSDWKLLPGIGDYTAAAISSIAFDVPAAVVDGNVERVFCRLLDWREAPNQPHLKRSLQALANQFLDQAAPGDFNQAVMELGQTICTPTKPRCSDCPLSSACLAQQRGSQALAPAAKLKGTPPLSIAMELRIYTRGGNVALVPRPQHARFLGGTSGFITAIKVGEDARLGAAPCDLVLDGWQLDPPPAWAHVASDHIGSVRHSITHHRIIAAVYTAEIATLKTALPKGTRWVSADAVEAQLIANLDRKAWHCLQSFQRDHAANNSLFV